MPGMAPEDVYELTGVADPRLSPDGSVVAFVVWRLDRESNRQRSAVWLARTEGSSAPRQFTAGTGTDANPRWSPDGRMLVFTSKRDDGAAQLYVIPIDGGEARKLTDLKEDVEQPAWSPDGSRIAFASRVRHHAYDEEDERKRAPRRVTRLQFKLDNVGWIADRPSRLFVVTIDGSRSAAEVTAGEFEDHQPAWSPDGRRIAFTSARHADWDVTLVRDVYVVDAEPGSEPERVTLMDGTCMWPAWSPDGTRIAYLMTPGDLDDPHHARVAVVDLATGATRSLTDSLDRTAAPFYEGLREPIWEDGGTLLFAAEDRGDTPLYRVPVDGSLQPRLVEDGHHTVLGYDAAAGRLAEVRTTPAMLPELFVDGQRITSVGAAFASTRELVEPEEFTAVSSDGLEVQAWVMRPAGFEKGKRYPTLLNIHGGPFTQYGNKFFDEFQVYAGAGYAVVYANPRGSSGYSEEWGRAIRGPSGGAGPGWGTVDYDDVMAVIDEAVKRFDFVDADRLGVMGGSYGGYLTSWVVSHTDLFRAAISERSVNNFVSQWGSSDFGWSLKAEIGSFLHEDFEAWVRHSPATYAADIETPLLILHSENDLRCPVEQAEQLFTTLRIMGKPVELVRFPAEGHELSRSGSPAHRVMRFDVILEWWRRHLED